MHYVFYQCTSEQGEETVVKTLSEARDFVKHNGGRYKLIFNKVETYSQTYVRKGARWRQ